jgi:hypothetical protein
MKNMLGNKTAGMLEMTIQVPEEFKGLLIDVVERLNGNNSSFQAQKLGRVLRGEFVHYSNSGCMPTATDLGTIEIDYDVTAKALAEENFPILPDQRGLEIENNASYRDWFASRVQKTDVKKNGGIHKVHFWYLDFSGLFLPHDIYRGLKGSTLQYKPADIRMAYHYLKSLSDKETKGVDGSFFDWCTTVHYIPGGAFTPADIVEEECTFIQNQMQKKPTRKPSLNCEVLGGGKPNRPHRLRLLVYKNVPPCSSIKYTLGGVDQPDRCPDCGMFSHANGHYFYKGVSHTEFMCQRFSGLTEDQKKEFNDNVCSSSAFPQVKKVLDTYLAYLDGKDDELGDRTWYP